MGIMIQKLFAQLLFWLYDFLDAVFETFQVLVGITPVGVEVGSMPLIDVFLTHSTVTQVFLSIFLLSIIVVAICTIARVVTNIVNLRGGERKSQAKTLGQGFGAILTTLVMAVVLVTFIFVSNSMLQFVQKSFNPNYENLKFSQIIFDMSVESSYKYDYDKPQYRPTYILDENGKKIQSKDENGEPLVDENNQPIYEVERDENGNIKYEKFYEILTDENGNPILDSGWLNGTIADIDFSKDTPDTIFGVHQKDFIGLFELREQEYIREAKVDLESFNFWTAYLVVIVMLVAIIWSMLGLVKRIFDLVFLLLALPLVSATIPLDDGAKFKTWRDTVISKIILAFGAIFSINVFLLLMPIINEIDFVSLGWSKWVESIFKMFLMMGGALSINGGQLLAARLVGADASESREMTQSARALAGGIMAAGGLARGVKNAAIGGQNKYGRSVKGVLPFAGKVAGGAGNLAGTILAGNAYRNMGSAVKGKVMNTANALRGLTKLPGGDNADKTKGGAENNTANTQTNTPGTFHNGLLGAVANKAHDVATKTAIGSNLMAPLTKPKNENVNKMVDKMSILPKKDSGGGAKKPPKK